MLTRDPLISRMPSLTRVAPDARTPLGRVLKVARTASLSGLPSLTTGADGLQSRVSLHVTRHPARHRLLREKEKAYEPGHKDRDGLQAVGGSTSLVMARARELLLRARGGAPSWAQAR